MVELNEVPKKEQNSETSALVTEASSEQSGEVAIQATDEPALQRPQLEPMDVGEPMAQLTTELEDEPGDMIQPGVPAQELAEEGVTDSLQADWFRQSAGFVPGNTLVILGGPRALTSSAKDHLSNLLTSAGITLGDKVYFEQAGRNPRPGEGILRIPVDGRPATSVLADVRSVTATPISAGPVDVAEAPQKALPRRFGSPFYL